MKISGKYKVNNWILELTESGNTVTGKYYKKPSDSEQGSLDCELNEGIYKGTYKDPNGSEGVMHLTFTEEGFIGKWGRGKDTSSPRGKWDGVRISETDNDSNGVLDETIVEGEESQLVEYDCSSFCKYHHFSLMELDEELDFFNSIQDVFIVFENEDEEFLVKSGDNYEYVEDIASAIEIGSNYLATKSFLSKEVLADLSSAAFEQEDDYVFEDDGRVILGIEVDNGNDLDEEVFEGMQGILYQVCPSIDIQIEYDCFNVEGEIVEDANEIMGYSNYIVPPVAAIYTED